VVASEHLVPRAARVQGSDAVVLDPAYVWSRVRARLDRVLLELDRVVACGIAGQWLASDATVAAELCASLSAALRDLDLLTAVDIVERIGAACATGLDPVSSAPVSELLGELRAVVDIAGSGAIACDDEAPLLHVVGDGARADALLWLACQQGWRVTEGWSADVLEASRSCIVTTDVAAAMHDFLGEGIPTIAWAPSIEEVQRRALAAATTLIVVGSAPVDVLRDATALVRRDVTRPVLAVPAGTSRALLAALDGLGVDVDTWEDASEALAAARDGRIDAMLLLGQSVAAHLDAISLCRTDPVASQIGIVAVLADDQGASVCDVFDAGADQVVPASTPAPILARSCHAVLARRLDARIRRTSDDDGQSPRRTAIELEHALAEARVRRRRVGLGLFVPKQPLTDAASRSLGERLTRDFRRGDVVGAWTRGRFVVALPGAGPNAAIARFEEALTNLGLGVECRVGVACLPEDGASLEELTSAAELALRRTQFDNGSRVVSHAAASGDASAADVLVVDPDPTLRALVVAILERRGLQVVQLNDGVSALEYLTASRERALPKVLLMELDLLGIDGFQLLRALDQQSILTRMRALVLTSRIRESELVDALELGASDIVTKPFSPALMMHRLQRLLDE
jgi:DNA-binding response OmpR family regulator